MANAFSFIELHTPDIEASRRFYTRLFDWKVEDTTVPVPYTRLLPQAGPRGGMMKLQGLTQPFWLTYVTVDDVQAATLKARELGAQVLQEPVDLPGVGRYSLIRDPQGAALGLWQIVKAA